MTRLALVVGGLVAAAVFFGVWRTVAVMAAVILMIMLHELGHYVMARRAGMKVTEFFLGFGPRLWSIRRGETEYGIKAIPVGGYVRVIGMNNLDEVDPADEQRTYRAKGYLARLAMASAGSIVHFLLAFLLLVGIYAGTGVLDSDKATATPVIDEVSTTAQFGGQASPAAKAGLRSGDRLVALDGQPVRSWADVPAYIGPRVEQPIVLTIDRDGSRFDITVVTASSKKVRNDEVATGLIGILPEVDPGPVERVNPVVAAGRAGKQLVSLTGQTVTGLVRMFTPSSIGDYGDQLAGKPLSDPAAEGNRFLSPVGLVNLASDVSAIGLREVLMLLVLINVFVGMFNMIPLPPFDGGHVAVATYEAIRSKISGRRYQVDMNKLLPVAWGVIILLMLISVTALYLDIKNPINLNG
ncbi:MAG TPA: M50 family metallopeptidase [Acidimicrobiales bacterium]|nr:M50 family metallopeptidase [Acidimicrobiales bacterium]